MSSGIDNLSTVVHIVCRNNADDGILNNWVTSIFLQRRNRDVIQPAALLEHNNMINPIGRNIISRNENNKINRIKMFVDIIIIDLEKKNPVHSD